jgi:hypothetical protein
VQSQQAGAVVPASRHVHQLYDNLALQAAPAGGAAGRARPRAQGRHRPAVASAARLRTGRRRRPRRWDGAPHLCCRPAMHGTRGCVQGHGRGGRAPRRERLGLAGGTEPAALSIRYRKGGPRADGGDVRRRPPDCCRANSAGSLGSGSVRPPHCCCTNHAGCGIGHSGCLGSGSV